MAHRKVKCRECGCENTLKFDREPTGDDIIVGFGLLGWVVCEMDATCPECRFGTREARADRARLAAEVERLTSELDEVQPRYMQMSDDLFAERARADAAEARVDGLEKRYLVDEMREQMRIGTEALEQRNRDVLAAEAENAALRATVEAVREWHEEASAYLECPNYEPLVEALAAAPAPRPCPDCADKDARIEEVRSALYTDRGYITWPPSGSERYKQIENALAKAPPKGDDR